MPSFLAALYEALPFEDDYKGIGVDPTLFMREVKAFGLPPSGAIPSNPTELSPEEIERLDAWGTGSAAGGCDLSSSSTSSPRESIAQISEKGEGGVGSH